MRKLAAIFIIITALSPHTQAAHIKGGEIFYTYVGPGTGENMDRYKLTLRLFLDCNAQGGQLDASVNIGIFYNTGYKRAPGSPFTLPLTEDRFIRLQEPNPCINNPSAVCYRVRIYTTTIDLPKDPVGYTAVFQRCCRVDGITNIFPNQTIGSSYTCRIHGTNTIGTAGINSSPSFEIKDTVLICQNSHFQLDFGATDPDGDSLSYEFCNAYSAPLNPPIVNDPAPPNDLADLTYAPAFSGYSPLGDKVHIDRTTGLIEGIAPRGGDYAVSVCVREWRNRKQLSSHQKDFIIRIDDRCDLAAAYLENEYINCDSFSFDFINEAAPSSLVHTWSWNFDVGGSNVSSNQEKPSYTYPDTGVYKVKLVINKGEVCTDSAYTTVKIYPGFEAGFDVNGSCKLIPFQFNDTTRSRYGTVIGWQWSFGDDNFDSDQSFEKSPSWFYATTGFKTVSLIVTDDKGCQATVTKEVEVKDKPPIELAFRDTLICSIDTLQLQAAGNGNITWTPDYNINSLSGGSPLVSPDQTTIYHIHLNENGCINDDSVNVRVVDHVTLDAGPNQTICLTDPVTLMPTGDGLYFTWSPAATLDNNTVKNPVAIPAATTTYSVIASIGKCTATDQVTIRTVPYPVANAGPDTTICYGDTAFLHGSTNSSRFIWVADPTLSDRNRLDPRAWPLLSQSYSLLAYDTLGCPKPGRDEVLVTVREKIIADAGNDTTVVRGQPLTLHGSGAEFLEWQPSTYLTSTTVSDPISIPEDHITYTLKAYTLDGCFDTASIYVKVFKTSPDVFVPNAFTPAKATNNRLRPIAAGIAEFYFFKIYNRWGQLVYQTSANGDGWDGTLGGQLQSSGTYVWMLSAKDYTGRQVLKKGTAVLIR